VAFTAGTTAENAGEAMVAIGEPEDIAAVLRDAGYHAFSMSEEETRQETPAAERNEKSRAGMIEIRNDAVGRTRAVGSGASAHRGQQRLSEDRNEKNEPRRNDGTEDHGPSNGTRQQGEGASADSCIEHEQKSRAVIAGNGDGNTANKSGNDNGAGQNVDAAPVRATPGGRIQNGGFSRGSHGCRTPESGPRK
jgi:hypothetical protein